VERHKQRRNGRWYGGGQLVACVGSVDGEKLGALVGEALGREQVEDQCWW
jgi:hypothetical protein